MSRLAKVPIKIPEDIKISLDINQVIVTGKYGTLMQKLHKNIILKINQGFLIFRSRNLNNKKQWMQAGTCKSLVKSMIYGVTKRFVKKLQFLGVGYRISLEGAHSLKMLLGFSHPIVYKLPLNVSVLVVSQNELELKSCNKQLVGQVAANIRSFRIPEPYKGKGIRYFDEKIRLKEAKKK
ncbi:50S ribosomal protein L6 [Buchnera aphidicola]|uniref:50S ribosomal protein L6 n=1 Tax=Buchnera aphidicola TaxID=9 RepID=UPI0031B6E99A